MLFFGRTLALFLFVLLLPAQGAVATVTLKLTKLGCIGMAPSAAPVYEPGRESFRARSTRLAAEKLVLPWNMGTAPWEFCGPSYNQQLNRVDELLELANTADYEGNPAEASRCRDEARAELRSYLSSSLAGGTSNLLPDDGPDSSAEQLKDKVTAAREAVLLGEDKAAERAMKDATNDYAEIAQNQLNNLETELKDGDFVADADFQRQLQDIARAAEVMGLDKAAKRATDLLEKSSRDAVIRLAKKMPCPPQNGDMAELMEAFYAASMTDTAKSWAGEDARAAAVRKKVGEYIAEQAQYNDPSQRVELAKAAEVMGLDDLAAKILAGQRGEPPKCKRGGGWAGTITIKKSWDLIEGEGSKDRNGRLQMSYTAVVDLEKGTAKVTFTKHNTTLEIQRLRVNCTENPMHPPNFKTSYREQTSDILETISDTVPAGARVLESKEDGKLYVEVQGSVSIARGKGKMKTRHIFRPACEEGQPLNETGEAEFDAETLSEGFEFSAELAPDAKGFSGSRDYSIPDIQNITIEWNLRRQ